MKLTEQQLRGVIQDVLSEAAKKKKSDPGAAAVKECAAAVKTLHKYADKAAMFLDDLADQLREPLEDTDNEELSEAIEMLDEAARALGNNFGDLTIDMDVIMMASQTVSDAKRALSAAKKDAKSRSKEEPDEDDGFDDEEERRSNDAASRSVVARNRSTMDRAAKQPPARRPLRRPKKTATSGPMGGYD